MEKLILCCFMVFILAGCLGENYDVGHPITSIENGGKTFELTPSFVSWSSKSDNTNYDKRQTELELPEIVVHQGEYLTLPPINEWGSKVQKISSLLSHQPVDAGWVQHKDTILFPLDFCEPDDLCHH